MSAMMYAHSYRGRPPLCEQCGKTFSNQTAFKKHILTHTGEKQYHCEQCGRPFSCQSSLKRHMVTHTGEKPHKCEQCGKTFSHRFTLKTHLLIHTGEKPFTCFCQKSFKSLKGLKAHCRIHSDERFKCQNRGCHRSFLYKIGLKYHLKHCEYGTSVVCDNIKNHC